MKQLNGKVAVVTGASKGIGAGIATALGEAGANVVVGYGADRAGAERTVKTIEASGAKAFAVQGDLSREADVKRLFAETRERFGHVDTLVNNAGVYRFAPIEGVTVDEYRSIVDTNLLGPILAIREAMPLFPKEGGSIINIGTGATGLTPPMTVLYIASKLGLEGVTGVLAKELGGRKIRVNSLNPGAVATEGSSAALDSPFMQQLLANTPMGRFGHPSDFGGIAVFLASDASAWITGETIVASGGLR